MKLAVLFTTILAAVSAQRPFFAGSGPIGVPELASRFKDTDNSGSTNPQFPNRLGTGSETSTNLPIDRQYQQYWPRENLPFSVINAEHIKKQLYPNGEKKTSAQDVSANSSPQSSSSAGTVNNKNPTVNNRGSFDITNEDSPNQFTVLKNNQLVTYVYDSASDTWYPKRN
nr:uncharacterized protein LOC111507766 [Leptinotarsa decemlineata]